METHMDEPCDICGDVGVIDAICTCYVCKISRQHTYCMENFSLDIPLFWRCEECEHSSETKSGLKEELPKAPMFNSSGNVNKNANSSGNVTKHSTLPGQSRSYREKWVDKGKTRYIPCGEAIKLSSGSKKLNSPLKNYPRSGPETLKPVQTICERTSSRPKVISPKITSPRVKENPNFGVLGRSKSPTPAMKIDSVAQESVVQSSTDLKENKAARFSKNVAAQIRQPVNEVKSPKKVESANTETEMERGGNCCENVEQRSLNAQERSQKVIVPEIETYSQILPSRHAYWKGNFKLPNGLKHLELNNGFNAYPPSKLRLRIYELLKKMPEELDFELVPRFIVLTDIFKDSCPDKDDIGLYFFPGNNKSYENYVSLLEFMWAEKLVLKSYVNGVELFVLTSRVLQPDFQQWHGIYYLWGVFRCVKKMANDKEHSLIVHPSNVNQESQVALCEVEDMDIDYPMNGSDFGYGIPHVPQSQSIIPPPGFHISPRFTAISPVPPPPGFENSRISPVPPPPGFENSRRPLIKTEVML